MLVGGVIRDLLPPGHWHYRQEGSKEPLRGDSYDSGPNNILQRILEWRIANRYPIGNIKQEFDDWFCKEFPRNCQMTTDPLLLLQSANKMMTNMNSRNVDRINAWIGRFYEQHANLPLMNRVEAQRRADICRDCPENDQGKWRYDCASCVENADRIGVLARRHQDVIGFETLGMCKKLGHCCRTAVWADEKAINSEPDLPANCWAKKDAISS